MIINSNFAAITIREDMSSHALIALDHQKLMFAASLDITILEPYPQSMTALD
jgi:hypothetical protein